jgi:hypothetical protein
MPRFRPLVRAFLFAFPFLVASLSCNGDSTPADAAPSDGMPPCSLGLTMADIEEKLFRGNKCKTCHVLTPSGARPLYPTNLEFSTPGLAERIVDKMSDTTDGKSRCGGKVLLPKNDPLGSLFVEKVTTMAPEMPRCGERMPLALPRLNDDEISCVKRWAVLAVKSVP